MMSRKAGFTLIELVITLVIVAILSIVSYNAYRSSVQKAKMTEGKTLLSSIADAEDIYYSENDKYLVDATWQQENKELGIYAKSNKYFRYFWISGNATSIDIYTYSGDRTPSFATWESKNDGLLKLRMRLNAENTSESWSVDNVNK